MNLNHGYHLNQIQPHCSVTSITNERLWSKLFNDSISTTVIFDIATVQTRTVCKSTSYHSFREFRPHKPHNRGKNYNCAEVLAFMLNTGHNTAGSLKNNQCKCNIINKIWLYSCLKVPGPPSLHENMVTVARRCFQSRSKHPANEAGPFDFYTKWLIGLD